MSQFSLQQKLRQLPKVDELLHAGPVQEALTKYPRGLVLECIRSVIDAKRHRILSAPAETPEIRMDPTHFVELVLERLEEKSEHTLRPVINGTGVVVHTNLGRSLLPPEALERIQMLCSSYNNLEYDLETGRRGSRYVHAESILCEITGAEAALVVNNNAGAVFLVLSTLAKNREVVVSRGQLVEIGGAFRIPDVMANSGAVLREVGCTNRTHPRDYESAVNQETGLLLKVHCSNYRIIGFTREVSLKELVAIGRQHGVPVMEDLGSGSFTDLTRFGLEDEPTVQEAVRAGADIVTFSGDKLLGGPQAGIILGRKDLVQQCKKNPITRALRVDKMTLAALESVLHLYRDEQKAVERIPTLNMISLSVATLAERARYLASLIREETDEEALEVRVRESVSRVGGGSLPEQDLPTYVVSVQSPQRSTADMERFMRGNKPPIIGRIEEDRYLLDVRTLQQQDYAEIQQAFKKMQRISSA